MSKYHEIYSRDPERSEAGMPGANWMGPALIAEFRQHNGGGSRAKLDPENNPHHAAIVEYNESEQTPEDKAKVDEELARLYEEYQIAKKGAPGPTYTM